MRKIVARIDALGDRLPAMTVFMLRRQKGWKTLLPVMFVHFVLLGVCVGILYYEKLLAAGSSSFLLMLVPMIGPMFVPYLLFFPYLGALSGALGEPALEKTDPMLLLTSLSGRELSHGSFLAGTLLGFSGFCTASLAYAYLFALNVVAFSWVFFYPFLCYLLSLALTAFAASLSVAAKTTWQRLLTFMIFFSLLWTILMGLVQADFRNDVLTPLFYLFPQTFFRSKFMIPIGCVAVPAFFAVAWKMLDYNLVRQRSFSNKLAATLGAYALWAFVMLGLWFGLWFLFA